MGVGSASVTRQNSELGIPGVKEFFALLEFLDNKDALKEAVLNLEKKRTDADTAVARLGKAVEIEVLHVKATNALEKAREKFAQAEATAAKLLDEAKTEASRVSKEAREYSKRAREKADKQEREFQNRKAVLDRRAAEVIKIEAVAKLKEKEAEAVLKKANGLKAEYEVLTEKLQKAMK